MVPYRTDSGTVQTVLLRAVRSMYRPGQLPGRASVICGELQAGGIVYVYISRIFEKIEMALIEISVVQEKKSRGSFTKKSLDIVPFSRCFAYLILSL